MQNAHLVLDIFCGGVLFLGGVSETDGAAAGAVAVVGVRVPGVDVGGVRRR
jgi:hypothetical protein